MRIEIEYTEYECAPIDEDGGMIGDSIAFCFDNAFSEKIYIDDELSDVEVETKYSGYKPYKFDETERMGCWENSVRKVYYLNVENFDASKLEISLPALKDTVIESFNPSVAPLEGLTVTLGAVGLFGFVVCQVFEEKSNQASLVPEGISSWEFLKSTPLPIAVYGTGNGADRVFEEFEHLGITVSALVASDGFVRSRTFRGFEVKSISGLENEIGDF